MKKSLTAILVVLAVAVAHGGNCSVGGQPNLCVRGKAIKSVQVDTPEQCCAVLQRDAYVAVYGNVPAGTKNVRLQLDGTDLGEASIDAPSRRWNATLPPQSASMNRTLTVTAAQNMSARVRVHFGTVVLCSGQSNMGMKVGYGAPATVPPPDSGEGPNKPSFSADNGTAETANAGRYTGRIFIRHVNPLEGGSSSPIGLLQRYQWNDVTSKTLGDFEAVCWYSGVSLFEQGDFERRNEPIGLVTAAVGGSPIEFWIPPIDASDVQKNPCGVDRPQCDTSGGKNDSQFFEEYIRPIGPYTFGAMVWDQAERDVKCPKSLAAYGCLQKYLISSWRHVFNSSFAFVSVQLAGYTAQVKNGTGSYDLYVTGEMVQRMRLQQEAGCSGMGRCSVVPTYDVSCQAGTDGGCPYGSVHQPHKREIGRRVGLQLFKHLVQPATSVVVEGPRATAVTYAAGNGSTTHTLVVAFEGGSTPFALHGTRNCTTVPGFCCDGSANDGHTLDFDVTHDGTTWVNSTNAKLSADGTSVVFDVSLPEPPTAVRYTAASIWPQCALYNADGLPARPFTMSVGQ